MASQDWQKDQSLRWRRQELGQELRTEWELIGKEGVTYSGDFPGTYIARKNAIPKLFFLKGKILEKKMIKTGKNNRSLCGEVSHKVIT